MEKKISVVVPVYNEEKNIEPFINRTKNVLNKIGKDYEIIFVLDPSSDETEAIINKNLKLDKKIKLIVLSRRFGQPSATMAGIYNCNGDKCVVIDCDLQDPPELIYDLNLKMDDGYDVVFAKRKKRKGETFVKKLISKLGYNLINKISEIKIPKDVGDFRIMSSRVISELKKLNESHGFLRGMVAYVGYKQSYIEYDRDERKDGKSKYNKFFGSIKIALNGIIGFSSKPLFLMSLAGFIFAIISFLIGIYYLIIKIIDPEITPGLSSTVLFITFFSGIQLLGLGLLGEYIGRIYDEVKKRPKFIIDKKINFDE